MSKLPQATISHLVKGRLRIKVPSRRHDKSFFDSVSALFLKHFPLNNVEVNPSTASTLFLGNVRPKEIVKFGTKHKLFKLETNVQKKQTIIGNFRESFKDVDRSITRFTGGEINIASIIFMALIGQGIYQIARGNFAGPAWYTAFWYALGVYSKSTPEDIPVVDFLDE
jgi:hypothetical protein